jgi:hypothetical protein
MGEIQQLKPSANPDRGEVEVSLANKTMIMRATFDALARIEAQTGMGIVELAKRYMEGTFGLTESVVIITEGLRAGSERGGANRAAVGEWVMKEGLANFVTPIANFLQVGLGGPGEADPSMTTDEN